MKQQQSHWTGGYGNVWETIFERNGIEEIDRGRDRDGNEQIRTKWERKKKRYTKIHRQRGWIVLVWLVYLFNFNTRWALGVIISALSKIRITSTEHYMCIHILLLSVTISYRFGRMLFFPSLFVVVVVLVSLFLWLSSSFFLFDCVFYLIPVWFLLRSHFSLFSHTVILHKTTNYFYTQL